MSVTSSEMPHTVLFIIVMEREALPFRTSLNLQRDPVLESNPVVSSWIGNFEGLNIVLLIPKPDKKFNCDSIGCESAAVVTYIGIETYNPDLIISCGTAGAFEKAKGARNVLNLGDVCFAKEGVPFIDREIVFDHFKDYMEGRYDVTVFEHIFEKLGFKESVIGSTNSFHEYCKEFSINKQVDLQEMEAASVGKICYLMNTPFMALKVISNVEYGTGVEDTGNEFWPMLDEVSDHMGKQLIGFLKEISQVDIKKLAPPPSPKNHEF